MIQVNSAATNGLAKPIQRGNNMSQLPHVMYEIDITITPSLALAEIFDTADSQQLTDIIETIRTYDGDSAHLGKVFDQFLHHCNDKLIDWHADNEIEVAA